jgi:protein ImuB
MTVTCLRGGGVGAEGRDAHTEALSLLAPRVAFGVDAVWLDGRGLARAAVLAAARDALALLSGGAGVAGGARAAGAAGEAGAAGPGGAVGPTAGVAGTPVAAFVAAGQAAAAAGGAGGAGGSGETGASADGAASRVWVVEESTRTFLAPLPIGVLGVDARLASLLEGVGVTTCGALAALPLEALEVRFGESVVTPWRWARGRDERRLFGGPARERPHASLDFIDYVVTDPERLLFTANALLGTVCAGLVERGEHARALELRFALAGGGAWTRVLRSGRPTADRATWLRLIRAALDRITVADAVAGVWLAVAGTEAAGAVQGDLFDPGFGTAAAVDAALLRLLETREGALVVPVVGDHPLPERRGAFEPVRADPMAVLRDAATDDVAPGLTLQLLASPRPVRVETESRRDHRVPVRYHDRGWHRLAAAAGPSRVSGGQWGSAYAREYFRAVTGDGRLLWLFRDGRDGRWYLHGWWD